MRLVVTITIDVEEERVRKTYGEPFAEEYLAILRGEKVSPEELKSLAKDAVYGYHRHGADLGKKSWDVQLEKP